MPMVRLSYTSSTPFVASEANRRCAALINLTIVLPGAKEDKMQIMVRSRDVLGFLNKLC